MLAFLKIAWRDLWRHKMRSGLTLAAVVFGSALTLFFMAWAHGAHEGMIRSAISLFKGYLQVHRAGYQAQQNMEYAMSMNEELAEFFRNSPLVDGFSQRLCTETLAQAGNNMAGTGICGVVPEDEARTSRLAKSFFPERLNRPKRLKPPKSFSGQYLESSDRGKAVIGKDLARNLQVEVGEQISILTQDSYGSMAGANFEVKGIFRTGAPEFDAAIMLVNLSELQDLLYMPGKITSVVVTVKSAGDIPALSRGAYQLLGPDPGLWRINPLGAGNFEIRPQKPGLPPDSPFQFADQEILENSLARVPGLRGHSLQAIAPLRIRGRTMEALGVLPASEKAVNPGFARCADALAGDDWLVLKSSLARSLGLEPGNVVAVEGADYFGENFRKDLNLAAVCAEGADAYVPLGFLQEQLKLGDNVNRAIVGLAPRMPLDKAAALLSSRLNYEVVPWEELAPDLVQAVMLDNLQAVMFLAILLVVVAFVFLLTILMSVLERARQFAIMKAIGTRPGEIFLVIFFESIFLGLLGTALGLLLGALPSLYYTYVPLNLAAFGEGTGQLMEMMGFEPFMYARLEPMMFLYTALINFAFVLLMTIFPALRASRTSPVQTLRLQ